MAALGQGVEEGVGGGVVALAGGAEGRRGRGVEDEGGEVEVPGRLVQVPGGVGLGGEDGGEALGVQRLDRAVVEDAGAVDDRGEGALGGDGVDQGVDLLPFGDVAGDGACLAAQLGQLGDQLRSTGCLGLPCG